MHEGVGAKINIILQNDRNEKLDFFWYKLWYMFKELSGVIFSVRLILPNVADCSL